VNFKQSKEVDGGQTHLMRANDPSAPIS
jgi:hypothetical protein